jgi:predicted nuclease with TOPRIM domain
MSLAQADIEQIQTLVEKYISERPEVFNANVRYELDLRERTIRVEEELKHQRELMSDGFKQMDKRFEQVDKRFEQVDKRFEQVDKRFEQVDKRFEDMVRRLDRFMFWSLGITVSSAIFVVSYLKP